MALSSTHKSVSRNWLVPILASITFACNFTLPLAGMPVLFKQISQDLNLNVLQIGSVWGTISIGSILIVPLGGLLCDRIGNKRAIVIIGLLGGITGALRGVSDSFLSLMAITFLWGLICAAIIPAISIITSVYAPSNKQGLAQGLIAAGGSGGLMLGSLISAPLLSSLLDGWRNVLFLYGGISILISLIWWFGVKEPVCDPAGKSSPVSFARTFTYLLRIKDLWVVGLSMLAFQGCMMGMQGFLPYFLEEKGWAAAAAGGTLAVYNGAGALFVVPFTMISDRIGSRKIILMISFLFNVIGIGLLSAVQNWLIWVLVFLSGALFPVASALFTTICIEIKEVGAAYAGTAVGIMLGIAFIGRAFAPPAGNSLAGIGGDFAWPFIFWAALGAAGLVALIFVKETGHRTEDNPANKVNKN